MWHLSQQDSENDVQSWADFSLSDPVKRSMSAPTTSDLHWMPNEMRMIHQIRSDQVWDSSVLMVLLTECRSDLLAWCSRWVLRQDGVDLVPSDAFLWTICSEVTARDGDVSYIKRWALMLYQFRMFALDVSPSHPWRRRLLQFLLL